MLRRTDGLRAPQKLKRNGYVEEDAVEIAITARGLDRVAAVPATPVSIGKSARDVALVAEIGAWQCSTSWSPFIPRSCRRMSAPRP